MKNKLTYSTSKRVRKTMSIEDRMKSILKQLHGNEYLSAYSNLQLNIKLNSLNFKTT